MLNLDNTEWPSCVSDGAGKQYSMWLVVRSSGIGEDEACSRDADG